MEQSRGVARAAGMIMIAMVISRILGYIRDVVIYAYFGQNRLTDAYNAAFSIPDLLYLLLVGGALSSAFIPIFGGYLARNDRENAWQVASIIFNLIMILLAAGITLGVIFTPQLMILLVPGFDSATMALTVTLTRIMFIQALFMALSGLSMGILNSLHNFWAPALGSVLYNLGIIVVGVLFVSSLGIAAFSLGVVVGAVANFIVQLPVLLKLGVRYRFSLNLKHPGVRQVGHLLLPVLIGLSVTQFNLFVNQNLASTLEGGIVAALRTGQRIMQLPTGVFAVAVGVAAFPTLTALAARGEMDSFKRQFSLGVRTVIFLTIPAAVGLMALRVPVVRLLFEQGRFTAQDTMLTAYALFYYSIGLVGYAGIQVLNRAFYALQDTRTPVTVGITTMALNIFLNYALLPVLAHGGLALAYSIAGLFNMVVLLYFLRQKIGGLNGRQMTYSVLSSLGASIVMGFVVISVSERFALLLDLGQKVSQLLQVGAAVAAGAGVYLGIAVLLRMEEVQLASQMLKRRFRR